MSHQLYGNPSQHLAVRAAGIQYLRENPKRFIESNLETSWLEYLKNMTMQGTWADNIIIQAVADAMNLIIHIVESNENFIEITVVEAANVIQNPRSIYISHISEMHYISTVAALSERSSMLTLPNLIQTIAKENATMRWKTTTNNCQEVWLKVNHMLIMNVQMKVQYQNNLLQVLAKKEKYKKQIT